MVRFWRLLSYAKKYKGLLFMSGLCNVLTALFTVISAPAIIPFLQILFEVKPPVLEEPTFSWTLDGVKDYTNFQLSALIEQGGKETALIYVCIGIILIFFLKNLFRYLAAFFMSPVRNGMVRDIRQQLFEKVIALDLGWFSERRKGDLMARVTTDVQEVEISIFNVLVTVFREPLVIIGSLIFLLYVSPQLTLFVFGLMLFTGVIIGGIGKTLKKKSAKVQQRLGDLVASLDENLAGLRVLKAFFNVSQPTKAFSNAFYNIQKGMAAVDRIDEILKENSVIQEIAKPEKINTFNKGIDFQNVNFAYANEERKAVADINLSIPKGKVVAIVGSSGSGKTTLIDLLLRFYDTTDGQILIDEINIKKLSLNNLRSLFGVVSQEPILFNDSIFNNITFGLPNCSQTEVEKAAKIANAHDFIISTENGYQTNIGDRGNKLSGGQRQRLTIARAILRNPPILILDEATSALDSASEKLVQDALEKIMQNRTTIIIAHRLSTIQHADEIVVLKDGFLIEKGTHQSLLEQQGEYRKFVQFQEVGTKV